MRSIIFGDYLPHQTSTIGSTYDVDYSHIRFLGDITLNLWDCGGQEYFMVSYIQSQREHVFKNVEVFIYVYPMDPPVTQKDLDYFSQIRDSLIELSPSAKAFVLIHKMDLVPQESRKATFLQIREQITKLSHPLDVVCFPTSIWNETLYRAWSAIIYTMIPNAQLLDRQLHLFTAACGATEAVLFEKTTTLMISRCRLKPDNDNTRYEKISNIVRRFRQVVAKLRAPMGSLEMRHGALTLFLSQFTEVCACPLHDRMIRCFHFRQG